MTTGVDQNREDEADNLIAEDEAKQKIIVAMYGTDHDLYYPYAFFEAETGLDRKALKPAMTQLREAGIMDFARGLMTEEGEVAGSGFGIKNYGLFLDAYSVVNSLYKTEDAFRRELDDLIRDLGIEYYQRKHTRGRIVSFIESHVADIQAIYGADTQVSDLAKENSDDK